MLHNKLSGTEDFAIEPSMDMWNSDIAELEESNHELDTFEFGTNSDLFLDEEVMAQEVDLKLTDLEKGKRSRSSTENGHDAKRSRTEQSEVLGGCDVSIASSADVSMTSAQLPFMTPLELENQLEQSMARLAESMQRSERSRDQILHSNPSSVGFMESILSNSSGRKNFSSATSNYAPLRSYMNQIGSVTL
ncbi:predicted protein [Chaetoceros tenuissimus]|uniref:Uncharacterized protein n=1 Tax=Chaetoceros tenuissimus TaxID=426638 RepID=A0AAD3H180_9STRA|nr:predicted protein [Chaetoceros tenuissimus]